MNNEQPYILDIEDGEEQEVVNLAGYQVTKAELFAHIGIRAMIIISTTKTNSRIASCRTA